MNGEQPQKKRRWIPIVIGILFVGFVVTIGGCFFAISLFRQNMSITSMSASSADDEFAKLRARFAGQEPLIEIRRRPSAIRRRSRHGQIVCCGAAQEHARDGVGR